MWEEQLHHSSGPYDDPSRSVSVGLESGSVATSILVYIYMNMESNHWKNNQQNNRILVSRGIALDVIICSLLSTGDEMFQSSTGDTIVPIYNFIEKNKTKNKNLDF